jgi:undecaprenyl-diphosphatase
MDISQLIQSIVLGIIQGITEWLPISSKAMMSVVMVSFYNMSLTEAVYYAIWLHIGSLFAVALFYRSDIFRLLGNLPTYARDVRHPSGYNRLTTFLIIATFATALVGAPLLVFGLTKLQLTGSYAIAFIGALLIGTGLLQLHARQRVGKRNRSLSLTDAIIVGLLQGVAILPGFSRSGLTVSALLLRRYSAQDALNLSFLMYIPAVIGAEIGLSLIKSGSYFTVYALIAIVIAFFFSLLTISTLLKVAERINFGYFCILIGCLALVPLLITLTGVVPGV